MSTPLLQVEGLTITTPSGLNLVDNVSLVLNAGEIPGAGRRKWFREDPDLPGTDAVNAFISAVYHGWPNPV
ncbi:hypothetical protein P4S72_28785 [Vibrio sp. PP-XX7]